MHRLTTVDEAQIVAKMRGDQIIVAAELTFPSGAAGQEEALRVCRMLHDILPSEGISLHMEDSAEEARFVPAVPRIVS